VLLDLLSNGQVQLQVLDCEEPPYHKDVTAEEEAAYQAGVRRRVSAAAEVVVEALGRRGLQLRTKDGQPPDVVAIADGPVLVVRLRRERDR
jgi:hypothetical protein